MRDANRGQFLLIELAIIRRLFQAYLFVDRSRGPLYHLRYPEYLRAEILLVAFRELHLLFHDTHVLPHAKFGSYCMDATSLIVHPVPYHQVVGIDHSRGRNAHGGQNRVLVHPDKFGQVVDISVRVFICKILIDFIFNHSVRTFYD